jgi:heme/copper-type cytochrome/quinol oxidase subunit 3
MGSEDPTQGPGRQREPLNHRPARPHPPPVPSGTGALGMRLFLVSLFMLFAAAMVGYVFVRLAGGKSPPPGSLHFPRLLWVSTALVICVSIAMSQAVSAVRREKQGAFRTWLSIALLLAIAFLLVQAPAMAVLLLEHERLRAAGLFLYGLVFFLILLHALHVAGGMIALLRLQFRCQQGVYDHEHYQPVRYTAWYWHFLDVIWIVMFSTFLLTA